MHEVEHLIGNSRNRLRRCFSCSPSCFLCGVICLLQLCNLASSLSRDGVTLLEIKRAIKLDPLKLLSSWKEDDAEPCAWAGVNCDARTRRVVSLNISGSAFYGWAGASENDSDGFCSFFSSRPSVSLQSSEPHGFSFGRGSTRQVHASSGTVPLCLQNGTVLDASFVYHGNDRVPCTLTGSLSPAIGNLSQLRMLSLPFHGLSGEIPNEIAALKLLEILDLTGNAFTGTIPAEFGQLSRLRILNLAYNSLQNDIPMELSGCKRVHTFNLAGNMLTGKIPVFLGNLPYLELLVLSFNQLDGAIPPELFSGCSILKYLHLAGNFLTGTIPPELGNCSHLQSLMLFSNFLSGPIPSQLGKLAGLQSLDVSRNSLGAEIPSQLGNCTQLSLLVLTNVLAIEPCINCTAIDPLDGYTDKDKGEYNYFAGALPDSVVRLPHIRILWAPKAGLNGDLPSGWDDCQDLEALNLAGNMFTGVIPKSLGSCRRLIYLDLSSNELKGNIPVDLLITCMVVFNISGNWLSGDVFLGSNDSCPHTDLLSPQHALPIWLDESNFLLDTVSSYFLTLYCGSVINGLPGWLLPESIPVVHDFHENNFTGLVPSPLLGAALVQRNPAYGLFLSVNEFTGAIPTTMFNSCQNFQMFAVSLSQNLLGEVLPIDAMVGCKSLRHFDAALNNLSGAIPPELGELRYLVYLDLGANNLSGRIPPQVRHLVKLEYLVLANNTLTGEIPAELGGLSSLILLDLSGNRLLGNIPVDLSKLSHLKDLMLNNNSLSGNVPKSFVNLTSLAVINLSFNNLSGTVPQIGNLEFPCTTEFFAGNEYLNLCSPDAPAPVPQQPDMPVSYAVPPNGIVIHQKHQPNSIFIATVASGCTVVVVLAILGALFHYTKHQMPKQLGFHSRKKVVVTFGGIHFHLTYDNVVRATGNFSVDNLIGTGGFGATYKAELMPGLLVAVKRLSLGRFQGIQQFEAEIRTLGRIRHPHLVTLIGYHASESEMFLIYNYLPGGNLESLIHNNERRNINWRVRYNIALDIAQALAYLHDECTPRVLHRDIKPSNILLDNRLNAYLSDFGLARLLAASETHATTDVAGTFGYVAPEYAMTCRVSDKADVYSYGVVLLELLSGKRALDPSFSQFGDGFNIVAWACQLLQKGQTKVVFSPGLWEQAPHSELIHALKLAVVCTVESLAVRPTMKQVVTRLKSLRLSSF